MSDTTSSDTVIVEQLKALNRAWCIDGGTNRKDGSTTADTDASTDSNDTVKRHIDHQNKQSAILTPLEKARIVILKLPPATSSSSSSSTDITTNNAPIVPYLFSVLSEKDDNTKKVKDEKNSSSSSHPLPPGTNKDMTNLHELRQMEWHVVLLLELWSCASQSTSNEGSPSKTVVLDALSVSILFYRDQSRQKERKTNKKKKRKRDKKNSKEPKASTAVMSEKEKETLFVDHLVQVLSCAPFLLTRDSFGNGCNTSSRTSLRRLRFRIRTFQNQRTAKMMTAS